MQSGVLVQRQSPGLRATRTWTVLKEDKTGNELARAESVFIGQESRTRVNDWTRPPTRKPRIAIVLDPRFSGGTCSAVAREVNLLSTHADISIFAIETEMFRGRTINGKLQEVLDAEGIELQWNPKVINSQTIVLHNPSALKFNTKLDTRMVCDRAFVVTHENFLRPNGTQGFDVGLCMKLIERSLMARERWLAPVSGYNRQLNEFWIAANGSGWRNTEFDWFNICDFEIKPPTEAPRDRRGRVSRPGFEKFPDLETMLTHFPEHSESCAILGGDSFLLDAEAVPEHWKILPFGEVEVGHFLDELDFFVYFTHPQWRESFGRVIAEAIAAGKVVITDPGTATTFGGAVVASDGTDVDAIIARFVADPEGYRSFVASAQSELQRFGSRAFLQTVLAAATASQGGNDALL